MINGKTIALTTWTFVGKVMSLTIKKFQFPALGSKCISTINYFH